RAEAYGASWRDVCRPRRLLHARGHTPLSTTGDPLADFCWILSALRTNGLHAARQQGILTRTRPRWQRHPPAGMHDGMPHLWPEAPHSPEGVLSMLDTIVRFTADLAPQSRERAAHYRAREQH